MIEDDAECADALREMLSQEKNPSFEMECAKKLQTGLERLAKGGIHVVLLDLVLPDSQGLDTLARVQAQAAEIPIIVVTGMADETHALEALRHGAQEYLVKGEVHGKMLSRVMRYAMERMCAEERVKVEKAQAERLAKELDRVVKELKEAQEEMLRREKVLATGELAAAVAHEIRNPLSIISMSVQYLQSKFLSKDPRREFTEAIVRKVQRLDAVTKRLVSYGRHRELKLVRRNLKRCLGRTLSLMKVHCKAQGIAIVRRYSSKLPLVVVDEEMLDEALTNLLTNAVEAMPKGGKLMLEAAYDPARDEAVIKINDTGIGILPKYREDLFKPFFSTKKESGGTGLGLAISHRIIADHGGSVTVESCISGANRGTSFTIRLPVKGPHLLPPSSRASAVSFGDYDKQGKKVVESETAHHAAASAHH
ncbi:MAG: response regulator [Candidatus Omnitrophica bacterium]|nr:response regulator [Candidatus Omnitrophota bacterium]